MADFADFDPIIGCHGNVRWAIGKGSDTIKYLPHRVIS